MSEILRKQFPVAIRATGERTVSAIISLDTPDRDSDTIAVDGWQLANYKRNPVVMWGHDYSEPPIARATSVDVVGGSLRAGVEFPPPGISARADEICGLVKAGFVSATSVGFRPMPGCAKANDRGGTDFTGQELLEFSFVAIPAHPAALVTQRAAMTTWLKRDEFGKPTSQNPRVGFPVECPLTMGGTCVNATQSILCPGPAHDGGRSCPLRGHSVASVTPAERRAADRALDRLWNEVRDDTVMRGIPDDILPEAFSIAVQLALPEMITEAVARSIAFHTGRVL